MRPNQYHMLALAVMLLTSGTRLLAEDAAGETATYHLTDLAEADDSAPLEAPDIDEEGLLDVDPIDTYSSVPGGWMDNPYLIIEPVAEHSVLATRFGWWGVNTTGSKAMIGEWQDLDSSSPFYDVDGLFSDGFTTTEFFATGTENESTMAGLRYYYGPGLTADVEYRRYQHRLGHDPLGGPALPNGFPPQGGFYNPPLPSGDPGSVIFGEDFTPDADYAIRVQQLQADFKGRLTDNVRWRLNVWGMRKEGTRSANSHQHCFNQGPPGSNRTCHAVSQGQRIDWLTMEVEPAIEARFDWLTVEYSRTMRTFQQNDDVVLNDFNSISPNYGLQAVGAYGIVPENYTEIDRFKMHGLLRDRTNMYIVGHVGNTHNKFRDSDRKFWGVDARLTDNSIDGLTLTAYGKTNTQNNSPDTTALDVRYPGNTLLLESMPPQTFFNPDSLYLSLVDRVDSRVGFKTRWRPFYDSWGWERSLAFTGGYEYRWLQREQVTYDLPRLVPFTQPTTVTNSFFYGLQHDWSNSVSSYVRYRYVDRDNPLLGVTHRQQLSLDAAINSNQPEREDRVEIGGTWNPVDNFLVSGSFWIQNSHNHSEYVNFDEDNYPLVVSAWYGLNDQWSFTGGFASFSNWVDQDITLGREDGSSGAELPAWTSNWNYTGRSDVVNFGAAYAYSCNLTLTGGLEYVRSRNFFEAPPAPATAVPDYSDLPTYSAIRTSVYRLNAGVDYELSDCINSFIRYNYYQYDDEALTYNNGTANMVLGGLTGTF